MRSLRNDPKFLAYTVLTSVVCVTLGLVMAGCSKGTAKGKPNIVYKESSKPEVLASIMGKEITKDELIGDQRLKYVDIKKKEYEFFMERLDALIKEKFLGQEAEKAGMSLDDYIAKKVVKGEIKISEKQFNDFVKEKRIPEKQINPQIKERINNYLQEQARDDKIKAHLAKLTKKSPVIVHFKKPKLGLEVAVGDAPLWGNKSAPITIVEFSDFQCPFCSRAAATVDEVKKKYKGKVKLAFRHFPLSFHKEARPAAEASMCVNEQSTDKFWKFHDIVFKNQRDLDNASLEKYAKQSGADMKKFKECMGSKKFAKVVSDDMAYGDKLGVRSTPTFFINGEILSGAQPLEAFAEVIDEALAEKAN